MSGFYHAAILRWARSKCIEQEGWYFLNVKSWMLLTLLAPTHHCGQPKGKARVSLFCVKILQIGNVEVVILCCHPLGGYAKM